MKTRSLESNQINSKALQKQSLRCTRKNFIFEDTLPQTAFIFTFHLNILNVKLQCKWGPQQMFFCGHRGLQLFCHSVEADFAIKSRQKWLERKFC